MISDDRTHTVSWDAQEVRQQAEQSSRERPEKPRRSQPESTAAAAGKDARKKKKKKKSNPVLSVLTWAVVVVVSSMLLAGVGWMLASDFAALNKGPYTEIRFDVTEDLVESVEEVTDEDGETKEVTHYDMAKIADQLKEKGLIRYKWFFRLFCRFYHADTKIDQGSYTLHTEMDYMALIRYMRPTTSDAKAETVNVTIPEGYSVAQIIDLLVENGVGTKERLEDTAANYVFEDYEFVDNENLGDARRLEGYLFPDTYNFYVGGRPELVFNSMLSNFNRKVYNNADLEELFSQSEYDLHDILTIASLIEKETDGEDRDRISSVIYNRLHNDGETHYLLQIDAALVYAAGREITQADYETLDSPYNLYQHTGLPPTPICNPGLTSIGAALQPADTNYYFYVLGKDGKHIFNETLAGHQRTMAQQGQG